MSFSVGIAVGLALGIAIGVASGRKDALQAIVAYAQARGIVVLDASGAAIRLEDFLNDAVKTDDKRRRPLLLALVVLGVLILVGLLAYFWQLGS